MLITVANDVSCFLIENCPRLVAKICKKIYFSNRSFEQFRNNILWNQFIEYRIEEPQYVAENIVKIYFITKTNTIGYKFIKIKRMEEFLSFASIEYYVALIIELLDFILPKLYDIVCYIGQLIYSIIYSIKFFKILNKK
uniref:hypothetical protein n=1 Tax=Erythrolobus coxiae TaxID=362235 RepID=UPI001FCD861D|nr:hypothetical protein MW556_pgp104 [Erythrolobus coxiae]UNJ17703.1 hypothetical protein [Erythrolobus coxiae]